MIRFHASLLCLLGLSLVLCGCDSGKPAPTNPPPDQTSTNPASTVTVPEAGGGGGLAQEAARDLAGGQSFPFDFIVTDFANNQHSLSSYQGKVVVVDIWGTWCPPCRMEVPSFIKLQETYGPQGFQMLGLNYENGDAQTASKQVTEFITENGINYPCALGTKEIQAQVPDFEGFPTTIFIDKTGKVRMKAVGLHEYEYLEAVVKTLLAE